ncbi:MAG: hypothetical protein QOD93_5215 [Acetobacteraceae bacterium]|nr:hypothetical protein [Acetobacteraceae bacterium]
MMLFVAPGTVPEPYISCWRVLSAPSVALVVEMLAISVVMLVVVLGEKIIFPPTSQSPAVSEMLVTLALVAEIRATDAAAAEAVTASPTFPAAALSLVAVAGRLPAVPNRALPATPAAETSSVSAVARLALDDVASHEAMPVPRPLMPVATGRPVMLDALPPEGVPHDPPFTTNPPAVPVLVPRKGRLRLHTNDAQLLGRLGRADSSANQA